MKTEITKGIKLGLLGSLVLTVAFSAFFTWVALNRPGPCDTTNQNVDYSTYTDSDTQWSAPLTAGDYSQVPVEACGLDTAASRCTIGLIGIDQTGDMYAITAAHCIEDDENKTLTSRTVSFGDGSDLGTLNPPDGPLDVGRIQIDDRLADPHTLHLAKQRHTITEAIVDTTEHIGKAACHVGTATLSYLKPFAENGPNFGATCGTVYQRNDNTMCFTAIGNSGDSGSLVFQQGPNQTVTAFGILSTAAHETNWRQWPNHNQPSELCYEPIEESLAELGLTFPPIS